MKKIILTLSMLLFFSSNVNAVWQTVAQTYTSNVFTATTIPINITDYVSTGTGDISSYSTSNVMNGTTIYNKCSASGPLAFFSYPGSNVQWMILPNNYKYNGLSINIIGMTQVGSISKDNAWYTIGTDQNYNYQRFSVPVAGQLAFGYCGTIGGKTGIKLPVGATLPIQATVDRSTAKKGRYIFNVPATIIVENNVFSTPAENNPLTLAGLKSIFTGYPSINIPFDVTVQSACDFNNAQINISHGSIVLDPNVKSYPTANYPITLTCTGNTSVSVKLTGSMPVSGQTSNYTQCGQGSCEVVFDMGSLTNRYNESLNVTDTQIINIRSIYHPAANPIGESFTGSAVLTILVN